MRIVLRSFEVRLVGPNHLTEEEAERAAQEYGAEIFRVLKDVHNTIPSGYSVTVYELTTKSP